MARAAFIRERTSLRGTAGWLQIAAGQPEWPPAVDGYNLCYLRNGATAACVTEDGNAAPLVSFWNRGTGRTAAVTFAMGGDLGKNIQQWCRRTRQETGYGFAFTTVRKTSRAWRNACRKYPWNSPEKKAPVHKTVSGNTCSREYSSAAFPSRTESDGALCFLGKPDRFAVVILQVRFLAVYIAEYPPLFFAVLSCL